MALGLEKIVVRCDACAECAWAVLQSLIASQMEQARRLLQPWGRSEALNALTAGDTLVTVTRPLWQAQNPPLSRRDLFRLASRRGQTMIARAVTQEDGTAARRPARERQRVLNAIAHLPPRSEQAGEFVSTGPGFANVNISEDCTACGVCARACPTGALQFHQAEGTRYRLEFTASACIGCQICAHVCAPGALTVEPQPSFQQVFGPTAPVELRQGELVRCEKCRAWFAARPGARLCPACTFRNQNPFGSRTVPGLMKVRS
jgi:ferredoxin